MWLFILFNSYAGVPLEANRTTLYIYIRSVAKVRGWGKNPQKGQKKSGSVSPSQQDVIHPGLSGSRGRPALGSGRFLQDWSEND